MRFNYTQAISCFDGKTTPATLAEHMGVRDGEA
jgi:hypothetical protein